MAKLSHRTSDAGARNVVKDRGVQQPAADSEACPDHLDQERPGLTSDQLDHEPPFSVHLLETRLVGSAAAAFVAGSA
jgi:hypothetical protein